MYGIGYRIGRRLGGYFSDLANAFKTRVLGDGGTYESGCLAAILGEIGQPILDQASLLTTPNAYKASTIYSIIPTDASGDLDFSRASTATRVNADGEIEEVASNVPRMDYTNGCPQILLEPQRTNLVTYSEDLSDASWSKLEVSITADATTAPNGTTTADEIVEDSDNNCHLAYPTGGISGTANPFTASIFIKKNTRRYVFVQIATDGASKRQTIVVDLDNGDITDTESNGTPIGASYSVEDYGNGWYRAIITATNTSGVVYLVCGLSDSATPTYNGTSQPTYQGDGTSSSYFWGAMVEQGSYATSYIKTEGATATRLLETSSTSGLSSVIGQTEGVLYMDFIPNYLVGHTNMMQLINNSANRLAFYFDETTLTFGSVLGGVGSDAPTTYTATEGERIKVAFAYKANDWAVYVNGVSVYTNTTISPPTGFTELRFSQIGSTSISVEGRVNSVLLSDTRLTDQELSLLTTKYTIAELLTLYQARVLADSGTYESQNLLSTANDIGQYLVNTASLIQIPSGYKADTLYSFTPTDASGDLDFTRASTATRVNEDGLIEEVASGVPRIEDGALLLEPQRTNLITDSEDFSDAAIWTKNYVTISTNAATAPDGTTTADEIVEDSSNSRHMFFNSVGLSGTANPYTASIFIKKNTRRYVFVQITTDGTSKRQTIVVDLDNGDITDTDTLGTPIDTSYSVEDYGNGWYRAIVTATNTSGLVYLILGTSGTPTFDTYAYPIYQGDGTSGAYFWGAMVEQGSYATSYIKTEGAAATRLVDTSSTSGLSSVIGQTEGVINYKVTLSDVVTDKYLTIGDGTAGNKLVIFFDSDILRLYVSKGSVAQINSVNVLTDIAVGVTYNIAVKYKLNDFAVYVNGVKEYFDVSADVPLSMSDLFFSFETSSSAPLIGRMEHFLLFDTALTDHNLIDLTTSGGFDTYLEMAEFYGHTEL